MTASRGGRTLAIEASGEIAGVALEENGRLLGESAVASARARSELLLDLARRLLDDLGLTPSDCDRIACSDGPGSFTGLRVGMAAAIGLALGASIPLVAVPTLEVHAWPWRGLGEPIVVLSGRRRGQVYSACFQWNGERFEPLLAPASRPEEEVVSSLPAIPGRRLLLAGDAIDSLAEPIRAVLGERAVPVFGGPARAASVACLAADPARSEWSGAQLEGLTPRYLREADARKPRPRNS
jgi:tRNA threonylcarbamoyladenosine biosynthesis protein TsaB